MTKLLPAKVRDLMKVLRKLGFYEHCRVGSHAQFKNINGKRITIPIHAGKDIPPGTLKAILKDAEISNEQFQKLLHE